MKWVIALFALALTIAVVASFSPAAEAVDPDEALLKLFPENSEGLLFIDVAGLRNAELLQDLAFDHEDLNVPEAVREFALQTGLDLETDVAQVLIGRAGPDRTLAVVRAAYDPDRVSARFREQATPSETHSGRTLYRPDPDQDWAVSFVDGLVLVGQDQAVREAIDRMNGGRTALDDAGLVETIRSIPEGNQVWAVGTFGDFLLPDGLAPPMAIDLIDALERGTYQMAVGTAVTARAVAEFRTPDAASRTADLLRGVVALGKLQAFEMPALIQLLDGVRIDSVESALEIDFAADGALIRRLMESGLPVPAPGL